MNDLLLVVVLVLVVCFAIFFTWTLVGLFRSHVPFISSSRKISKQMVLLAEIKSGQKVYDLGCGRGAILFEIFYCHPEFISGSQIKMTGYELIRPVVWLANIQKFFIRNACMRSLQFKCADFFKEDLSDADIIFCYLWPSIMDRFYREKWQTLKTGTKIVSHGFPILNLTPIKREQIGKAKIFVYRKK